MALRIMLVSILDRQFTCAFCKISNLSKHGHTVVIENALCVPCSCMFGLTDIAPVKSVLNFYDLLHKHRFRTRGILAWSEEICFVHFAVV